MAKSADKASGKKEAKKAGKSASKLGAGARSPMDVGLLQQIIDLMHSRDLTTVDLRDGDKRVILRRGPEPTVMGYAPPPPVASAPSAAAPASTPTAAEPNLVPIKSPMVGTFYSKPSPDSKPFVTVGSQVDDQTDVCVIEAMKTFSTIKAECRGTIAKILVQDGASVAFDTVLFLVKP